MMMNDTRFNFKLIQRQFHRAKKLQSEIEVLGMQVAAATGNMGFYAAQINDRQQRRQRTSLRLIICSLCLPRGKIAG